MSQFSVILITAPPPFVTAEGNSATAKIDGREALLRSVELFLNRDPIKQIQLCFTPDCVEEAKRKFGGHLSFSGVKVVSAGPRWIDQCAAAFEKILPDVTHVIVHDAARPAVPYDDIDALLSAAAKSDAVCLTAPLRAALFEIDEGGNPVAFRPQKDFVQMLLPMAFSRARFEQIARSRQEPHASQFVLLKGSSLNVRAGGGDAGLVKAMINLLPKPRIKPPSSPFEEAQW